jgi:hypothetical protein
MTTMKKPVRLEINNTGAWKVIGRFDAADDAAVDDILNSANNLAADLSGSNGHPQFTMRVSMGKAPHEVLMRWESNESGWREMDGAPV